jgi:hypothetical protein
MHSLNPTTSNKIRKFPLCKLPLVGGMIALPTIKIEISYLIFHFIWLTAFFRMKSNEASQNLVLSPTVVWLGGCSIKFEDIICLCSMPKIVNTTTQMRFKVLKTWTNK